MREFNVTGLKFDDLAMLVCELERTLNKISAFHVVEGKNFK